MTVTSVEPAQAEDTRGAWVIGLERAVHKLYTNAKAVELRVHKLFTEPRAAGAAVKGLEGPVSALCAASSR